MKVIVSTWYDNFNQSYMTELYDSDVFESEILDYYEEARDLYGHKVMSRENGTIVFSDGYRVILTYQHVKNSLLDNEFKDPKVTTSKLEILRITE